MWETPDGGEVDNGVGEGGGPVAGGDVHEDRRACDGGDAHQNVQTHAPPSAESLDTYPENPPEMFPVDITDDVVTAVAGSLWGGAGLGGTELVSLQYFLLRFGAASGRYS